MDIIKEQKREEAGTIINVFAFAHSAVALTLANTVIGDTAVLTGLTYLMIERIGAIYNCNDIKPWKIMGKVFGFCAGIYIGSKLLFWLPGIGNVANATATFIVTQTIGWTCVFLMESFDDPSQATDGDWKVIMTEARTIGEEKADENEEILKKSTNEERKRIKNLNAQVRSGNLTKEQKSKIFTELAQIKEEILKR